MKTKSNMVIASVTSLFIATVLCAANVFAQEAKSVDPETARMIEEAKKNAQKQMEESQELIRKLIAEKNAAKTGEEKAAFQEKIQTLIKTQQQKLPDLKWQRKLARFKGLYFALLSVSNTSNGKWVLPKTIDAISTKTQINLNGVQYIGSLATGSKNAKGTILLYGKEADSEGRRILLFLDGHVEVSGIVDLD